MCESMASVEVTAKARVGHGRPHAARIVGLLALIAEVLVPGCASVSSSDGRLTSTAVERLTDQAQLEELALGNEDAEVRWAAAARLTNHSLLVTLAGRRGDPISQIARLRLALSDPRVEARLGSTSLAVRRRLISQEYVAPAQTRNPVMKGEAVSIVVTGRKIRKPVEQMWKTEFPQHIRRRAGPAGTIPWFGHSLGSLRANVDISDLLEKLLKDFPQAELAEMSTSVCDDALRRGALRNLTDEALITRLAVEDPIEAVRVTAVGKLADQTCVAKLAMEDRSTEVRVAAIHRLQNQTLMASLATQDKNWQVRRAAINNLDVAHLEDQALLAITATESESWSKRRAAVQMLTEQTILAQVSLDYDEDWQVREAAAERLEDQSILAKLLLQDPYWQIRLAAVHRVTDETTLAKVAIQDWMREVRKAAVARLTDRALLARVDLEGEYADVRRIARSRLRK